MQKTTDKLIIAIDGHSSSGKSTIAKSLAKKLNFKYIDTGSMYRAITYKIIQNKIKFDDIEAIIELLNDTKLDFRIIKGVNQVILDGKSVEDKIRGLRVSNSVSEISTIPEIRMHLVKIQREIGKSGGIVMDGRDIGTVVFPNAHVKFFVSAKLETRAKRRFEELKLKNQENITIKDVIANLEKRDRIDSNRKHSPLKIAEDAIIINTDDFTREEQLKFVLNKIFTLFPK